jgi:hypothetical protein
MRLGVCPIEVRGWLAIHYPAVALNPGALVTTVLST